MRKYYSAYLFVAVATVFSSMCLYASQEAVFKRHTVRNDTGLCAAEQAFVQQRSRVAAAALSEMLHTHISEHEIPNISVCFSGGSCRASISTIATLIALRDTGLLDACMYLVGLSGSTWTLASWYGWKCALDTNEPEEVGLKKWFKKIMAQPLFSSKTVNWDTLNRSVSGMAKQDHSMFVKTFGLLLAKKFFGNKANTDMPRLSEFAEICHNGSRPLPIFTAVAINGPQDGHEWIEFTPYEVGFSKQGTHVPTDKFGSPYTNGISIIDDEKELGLDFAMGIWGSAFCASLSEATQSVLGNSFLGNYLGRLAHQEGVAEYRLWPAKVHNFAFNVQNHVWRDRQTLELVDAGVAFNLPIVPVLSPARRADIIIIVDASRNSVKGLELNKAEKYAVQHRHPFPKIDYQRVNEQPVTVFTGNGCPTVVYISLAGYGDGFNPTTSEFCRTESFQYTKAQFKELFDFVYVRTTLAAIEIYDQIRAHVMS